MSLVYFLLGGYKSLLKSKEATITHQVLIEFNHGICDPQTVHLEYGITATGTDDYYWPYLYF
jgi:hypothetical protein